ncbi:MAG: hypothetical protein Q9Q13_10220 [Acidobacteriota bacterium]|nr:hypothetical protein [Acidobacteriota bacterium]
MGRIDFEHPAASRQRGVVLAAGQGLPGLLEGSADQGRSLEFLPGLAEELLERPVLRVPTE